VLAGHDGGDGAAAEVIERAAAQAARAGHRRSVVAKRPDEVPPRVPVRGRYRQSRWAATEVSFGPVGRIVVSMAMFLPTAWISTLGLVPALVSAPVYLGVAVPWALRDIWRPVRVPEVAGDPPAESGASTGSGSGTSIERGTESVWTEPSAGRPLWHVAPDPVNRPQDAPAEEGEQIVPVWAGAVAGTVSEHWLGRASGPLPLVEHRAPPPVGPGARPPVERRASPLVPAPRSSPESGQVVPDGSPGALDESSGTVSSVESEAEPWSSAVEELDPESSITFRKAPSRW